MKAINSWETCDQPEKAAAPERTTARPWCALRSEETPALPAAIARSF